MAAWADNPWTPTVLSLALIFQTIRRMHDLGRSGWWVAAAYLSEMTLLIHAARTPGAPLPYWLATLFPLVALLTVAILPGQRGENRFGPQPGRPVEATPAA